MKLFTSKVTRLTVIGPLAAAVVGLHRADYAMTALWLCVSVLWALLVYKQRRKGNK